MKPFDLEAALAGEPVRLRDGSKAYVIGKIPDHLKFAEDWDIDYKLIGLVLNSEGYVSDSNVCWTTEGKAHIDGTPLEDDIVTMWKD